MKTNKLYLIGGFLAILLVYSLYNIYLVDVSYYRQIPRKVRHINKLISILLVYGVGTIALKKYTVDWMIQIWHGLHILVIALLIMLGIYDWIFQISSRELRNIANTFHEFLISPIFYSVIAIFNFRILRIKNN